MADARTKQQQRQAPKGRQPAAASSRPDEVARRELVEWCKAHGLPVPPDRRIRR